MKLTAALKLPSPIQALAHPLCKAKQLKLWVKREDLIHLQLSGNKWRKLHFNLRSALEMGKKQVLTFGGAYSNHLYATAAAAQLMGWPAIGIVRGEAVKPLNPTLRFAQDSGMDLRFVSRSDYRRGVDLAAELGLIKADTLVLPEGGTNVLALRGCAEITEEMEEQLPEWPDYIVLCCGTGGTAAGLIAGLKDRAEVIGFSVLKGDFHQKIIADWLLKYQQAFPDQLSSIPQRWSINTQYHFGGYARFQPSLIDFINESRDNYQLPLDPIYTGKLFYGLLDLIAKDYFPPQSRILALHTGGLQGIQGFNDRHGPLIHTP